MNFTALKSSLAAVDPALSDAQVNTLPGYGVPILTPKPSRITYTSAGATLGGIKAATLRATLCAPQTLASPLGPVAAYAHDLLCGPGFDPSNADVLTLAGAFVQAGILSAADRDTLLFDASFVAGEATTEADIAAARAALAFDVTKKARVDEWAGVYNRGVTLIDAALDVAGIPTMEALRNA